MEEYIKLLDLPDEFDLKDFKKAYKNKILKYHPDKASNEAERIAYEALTKKLNEANEYLKEYLKNHGGKYYNTFQNDTGFQFNDYSENYNNFDNDTQEYFYNDDIEKEAFNKSQNKNFYMAGIICLILVLAVKITGFCVHNHVVNNDVHKFDVVEQKQEKQKHDDKKKKNINKEELLHKITQNVEYDDEEETEYVPITRDSEIFGEEY